MDDKDASGPHGSRRNERRRERRIWVPGVAVLQSGGQPPAVWRVSNLSTGGAALIGDGGLMMSPLTLRLHVAGFETLYLSARVLRQQLITRSGRCGIRFVDVGDRQRRMLRDIASAEHTPTLVSRRALVVIPDVHKAPNLVAELTGMGFDVRRESSPGQAAAWLQREGAEVLLVDESAVEIDRWSLLRFTHDTAPETRRMVLAEDVRGFSLYYAIKAGLVEGLVEPSMAGDALARHLLAAQSKKQPARRRAGAGGM
jgi:hypothetical protein